MATPVTRGEPTHASFFSGVGGLDLGLGRAGWRTVSFAENDAYASAVLGQRWPDVPNLGDITKLAASGIPDGSADAFLWTGGFPCQDLSIAGKRAGMGTDDARTRSGLAFAFLDLVAQHQPRVVLLENVPGLLNSHGGRDLLALVGRLEEFGYGPSSGGAWAYRTLDGRYYGVPQRRRRVFLVGIHARLDPQPDRAGEVLSVGASCDRHSRSRGSAGSGATRGAAIRPGDRGSIAGALTNRYHKGINTTLDDGAFVVEGEEADSDRDGAAHGLAGRAHDRDRLEAPAEGGMTAELAPTVNSNKTGGWRFDADQAEGLVVVPTFTKAGRAQSNQHPESWREGGLAPTVNVFDVGDTRATVLTVAPEPEADDELLPKGLDSNRYRCCGNGVIAPVAEFLGERLMELVR